MRKGCLVVLPKGLGEWLGKEKVVYHEPPNLRMIGVVGLTTGIHTRKRGVEGLRRRGGTRHQKMLEQQRNVGKAWDPDLDAQSQAPYCDIPSDKVASIFWGYSLRLSLGLGNFVFPHIRTSQDKIKIPEKHMGGVEACFRRCSQLIE